MKRDEKQRRRAFTLVEILLVVVIIGVLAGMVVTNLSGRSQQARETRAKADLAGQLSLALDLFEQDVGRYPTGDEGLEALVQNPGVEGWRGPYLKGGLREDPWGTSYGYSANAAGGFALVSAGPDRQFNTQDDVTP